MMSGVAAILAALSVMLLNRDRLPPGKLPWWLVLFAIIAFAVYAYILINLAWFWYEMNYVYHP